MRMAFLAGLAALTLTALAACVEEPAGPGPGTALTEAERADCLDHGGKPGRGGMLGNEVCYRPTPDAGKSCTKASQCSGHCQADSRTCSPVTPQFGCFEFLDETGQKVGLCVD